MSPVLREFETNIDAICGAMVRLCFSLSGQRNSLRKLASESGVPLSAPLHSASFSSDGTEVVHTATIQAQLDALEDGGHDEVLIGNICVSYVYSMWEDKYRGQFAQQLGIEKNAVKSDLFKELGTYRHAIVHNQAIGTKQTEKVKLLRPVQRRTPVRIDRHTFEMIIDAVKKELTDISTQTPAA